MGWAPKKNWIFPAAAKKAAAGRTLILVSCNLCKSHQGTHVGKLWLCANEECDNSRVKRLARGETPDQWRKPDDGK